MDDDQLLNIIKNGESQEVELKESFHSSQDFSKLMCAFSNTYGGIIVIGANSKREIVGTDENLDRMQQRISAAAQTVYAPLIPQVDVRTIDGKKVVAVIIQKAVDSSFHTFQGVIYVRIGSTTKRIEGNQMVDFLRGKQILCFDETRSNAKIDDIDVNKIRRYLNARKQADYLESHSLEDFLISMKLAAKNGVLSIKNSALMLFAKDPMFFNHQIEIKVVRFDGTEPVKIISHELVQSDLVESIERSLSFVKSNIPKSIEIGEEARRTEKYQYPIDVVREAIVNAVAHRDYFSKDSIQIYIFSDRIEITSPGSLPQGLPRELFGTISVQRNPITYRILRDYGYVEGLGSGVPRMINGMRSHGLADPDFGIYEHFLRVILKNRTGDLKPIESYADLNERQIKALEFLKKNKSIKTKMYIKINKVSFGTAIREIKEMIKFDYVEKVGSYRGVYYILKKGKADN